MSDVNQEAKDSSVPRDEPPERIWIHQLTEDGFIEREWSKVPSPASYIHSVEYVRADLVAPQGLAVSSRQREVWDAAIEIVNQLHLAPQFAGHYHNGFEMAKTGAIRRLAEARNATPASTGQHEVRDAEAIAKKLANEIAGHYCSAGPDHSSMRVTVFNIAHRIIRDATSASIGYDQRTIEACVQIAERHSCTHASGYRCYEGDKIAKTIRALATTPVHEGEK